MKRWFPAITAICFMTILTTVLSQNNLDLKKELGFTIKSQKSEIIKYWKSNNIPFKVKNSDVGSKYFLLEDSLKPFMGSNVIEMRVGLDKDKVGGIQLLFDDNDKNYDKLIESLDDGANKKLKNVDSESTYLFYDNLTVVVYDVERKIMFIKRLKY